MATTCQIVDLLSFSRYGSIMKIRESGMPEESYWESLFDPVGFLETLGFSSGLESVADFGSGYGTFTLPLARYVRGSVYALDLELEMIEVLRDRAAQAGIANIIPLQRDLFLEGSGLAERSVDGVLIANLLHGELEENLRLLQEAHRVLRSGGRVAIIHWRRDLPTPRGPTLAFRPGSEQCSDWCIRIGFKKGSQEKHLLGLHHWGLVMRK